MDGIKITDIFCHRSLNLKDGLKHYLELKLLFEVNSILLAFYLLAAETQYKTIHEK